MSKVSIFFSHDTNASQDPKILQMCTVYKSEGYGWFWMLVEKMAEQENYRIPIDGKYTIDAYAMRMYCDSKALHKFIDDCVKEFQLFQTDGKFLWSESLNRRMKYFEIKSEIGKNAAMARWGKRKEQSNSNANAIPEQSDGNTNKQNKQKEINELNKQNKQNGERNVFEIYSDNYQKLTADNSATLNDLIDDYTEEWVKEALQEGIDRNARSIKYIIKILENRKNGIKKPESNNASKLSNSYQTPPSLYTDVRDYGKYRTNPTP
jgi:DnaD/phage-associated family protein